MRSIPTNLMAKPFQVDFQEFDGSFKRSVLAGAFHGTTVIGHFGALVVASLGHATPPAILQCLFFVRQFLLAFAALVKIAVHNFGGITVTIHLPLYLATILGTAGNTDERGEQKDAIHDDSQTILQQSGFGCHWAQSVSYSISIWAPRTGIAPGLKTTAFASRS